ncbi:MAG: virulence RhuM family protein [Bacteroidales bacterium]|nr:virulence RhuM family protein [Bacteroidales bacterium]
MKNIEPQQLAPQSGEVVLYNPDDTIRLEVRMNEETVWLSQAQMAELFRTDRTSIVRHIKNIYAVDELSESATCAKIAQVRLEGKRKIVREIPYYNLDMIISVGFRVNSKQGILFRQWANKTLKQYVLKNQHIQQSICALRDDLSGRIQKCETILQDHQNKIDFFVRTALPPVEGIFFDGQIFDAYELVCRLIKSAKRRIVLIDNYIDESTLLMLEKRNKNVTATIYTHSIGEQLQLDIDRHNAQYQPITVLRYKKSHDRFLILDDDVYHVGASLKDLGKQWFAIMKMNEITAGDILGKI